MEQKFKIAVNSVPPNWQSPHLQCQTFRNLTHTVTEAIYPIPLSNSAVSVDLRSSIWANAWRSLRNIPQEHNQYRCISTLYQHYGPYETSNTYVAVPTNISYVRPSATTVMIIAKRKMKAVDVKAIIGCDILTRNKRNTGIRRTPMIVQTIRT
jgi:hypothetical protein